MQSKVNLKLFMGQSVAVFVAFVLALFLPAGTLSWGAGWLYVALFFGFYLIVNVWLLQHNPSLLQERTNLGSRDQQGWDKFLFPVLMLFPLVWLAFIALDAERLHWLPEPVWVQVAGGALLLLSFYLLFRTFRENSYLSPVVRHQKERGHAVVSTGLYHYVRHPMYSGMLVFSLATPLMLGSVWGLVPGIIFIVVLARRAVLEERMLQDALPGYKDYMTQVKYRFIPFLW